MPMPQEYQLASQVFDRILIDLRDELGLATRNQTYTTLQSVLIVFRRRLSPEHVLQFSGVLPPVARAIFVDGWEKDEFVPVFGDREDWTKEVRSIRQHHNFSEDSAIPAVGTVLRRHITAERFDAILASISNDATRFWSP